MSFGGAHVSTQCLNGLCRLCENERCSHPCHETALDLQGSLFGVQTLDEPVRPYTQDGQPLAGHSGTETSKAAEPIRAKNQAIEFE